MRNNYYAFCLVASLLVIRAAVVFAQTRSCDRRKKIAVCSAAAERKMIKAETVAPKLKEQTEFVLVGMNGVEERRERATKAKRTTWCQEFTRMEFDLTMDWGVALGSGAKWDPVPRKPVEISWSDGVYKKIVTDFLKTKKILKPKFGSYKAYRIDLEGDGKDEVVLKATYYADGLSASAKKAIIRLFCCGAGRRQNGEECFDRR